LEVETLGEHHIECSDHGSGAELESVSHDLVDLVTYVIQALLDEMDFGWFVQFSENDVTWEKVSHFE